MKYICYLYYPNPHNLHGTEIKTESVHFDMKYDTMYIGIHCIIYILFYIGIRSLKMNHCDIKNIPTKQLLYQIFCMAYNGF